MATPSRRRALLAAALAVAGGLGVGLLRGQETEPRAAPSTAVAALRVPYIPEETAAPAAPVAAAPAPRPVLPPPAARERPAIAPAALARATADDYRRRARYPRSSHPLEPGEDPIVRDREVTRITERGPDGEDPALTVFPLRAGFEAPEPAVVFAYLSAGKRRIPAREMRATVTTEALEPIATLEYNDDGLEGDAEAGDGLYTAVFQVPAADPEQALASSYLVKVRAVTLGEVERSAATSFLYSRPLAQLTGLFRDTLVDGSLRLDAEVDVAAAGRFHLEATLYTADGTTSLGWAQAAAGLTPGVQWMTLTFHGLILREKGIDGPYLVRYAALSTTTDMPNAKNRLLENAHVTQAYRAAVFTDRPHDDRALLEAADRIEQDQAPGGLEAGG